MEGDMSAVTFDTHAWNIQAPHETALQALKQLHWPVLPIGANKKPPVMWKRYQTRLPTLAEVNVWERKFHPSAWAIITGALSSRITLEFDGNEGRETLARL